jgi:hypothetical protein
MVEIHEMMGNLNKRNSAFRQQSFKLDKEWKAFMEAKVDALVAGMTKVDSMVEPMVEIKVMLHKRHGDSKIETYTNPSTTTNEGTLAIIARNQFFFQGDGNYFGSIYSHLGPHPSTP